MNIPAPVRCPKCQYLPASRVVICPNCGHDSREPLPKPLAEPCPFFKRECDCGLRGFCLEAA